MARSAGCAVAVLGYIFVALDIVLAVALYAFLGEMACISVAAGEGGIGDPMGAVGGLRLAMGGPVPTLRHL